MEVILICLAIGIGIMVLLYMFSLTDDDENTKSKTPSLEEFEKEYGHLLPHGVCKSCDSLTCLNKWSTSVEIITYRDCIKINEVHFPWDSIKNAVIKTDTQIQKDISAGKLLAFGVFALASKKTRTVTENYLVITYLNEFDNEEDLVFTHKDSSDGYPINVCENIKQVYGEYKNSKVNTVNNQEINQSNQENKEALQ